jgi:uncharacterized glyoxalase superfamily protein PhnB/catechol 2,3-dioxygenase-like lactoylglutathione lyase family enzyme
MHQPDRRFADELRRRIRTELVVHVGPTRASTVPAVPTTQEAPMAAQIITPYLGVSDGRAALDWYRRYFRASVSNIIDWEGRVGHSELEFGGAVFYLSDAYPAIGVVAPSGAGSSSSYVVLVADADAFIERAVEGGATLQREIQEAHGTRSGWIVDPFGHRWNIGTPLRTREEAAELRKPAEPYYFTLTTPDVERGAAFYAAVLGWELGEANEHGGRHVTNTKQPIGVRGPNNPFSVTEPGEIEMWWLVRDFDDALERVAAAGGRVETVTPYDSGREARCFDDQGVLFRLSEPAPGYDPA